MTRPQNISEPWFSELELSLYVGTAANNYSSMKQHKFRISPSASMHQRERIKDFGTRPTKNPMHPIYPSPLATGRSLMRLQRTTIALAGCLLAVGSVAAQSPSPTPTPTPSISSTIYVDSNYGSDTSGGGGALNPYASLTMACSVAQMGDTIVLHGGPFVQSAAAVVNVSNVTIMGNGATVQAANQANVVLLSIGAGGIHCTVRDLVVNGSLTNGADVDSGAIEVSAAAAHFQNVYVHDSEGYGFRLVASWDNAVIENCRVTNCSTGIQEAMYGTADVHNANFLSNRFINNRNGGIRGTNNSNGAYAVFGEKIIGNVIHNDTLATNALGIELYGGQIVGEAKISHQGADVSHNTVENQEYGISMNACGFSDVSHNLVSGCGFISIEFANTLGCTASANDMDCSAGAAGYSVSNNNADLRQPVDLHIAGGRVVNANHLTAVSANGVSGLSIENVYASGSSIPFFFQYTDSLTVQNCKAVITNAGSYGIYTEAHPGQSLSSIHYINNQLTHNTGTGNNESPFFFYCAAGGSNGTFNDVLIKNNFTDQTFSGSGFLQISPTVNVSPLVTGNVPQNASPQMGFVNADTIGTTTVNGTTQTTSLGNPGLNVLQYYTDVTGGGDLLAGGEVFSSLFSSGATATLGGVAGVVGDPGNTNNYPGGLALFYKAADGASGSLHEGMRLDLYGNVGIGTKSPAAKLEVNGTTQVDGNLTVSGAATITGALSANSRSVGGHYAVDANGVLYYPNHAALNDAAGDLLSPTDLILYNATTGLFTGNFMANQTVTITPSASQPATPAKGVELWVSSPDYKLHALDANGTDHPLW